MAQSGDRAATKHERTVKSNSAFRTISEVAEELDLKQHVLRFWETKFNYIKPMKRGGGRRYYRPEDVALLTCIRDLLYRDGYTIKGVQKLLRDAGGKPENIQENLAQVTPKPTHAATEVKTNAETSSASIEVSDSGALSGASRDELGAILEELIQLKGKLDGALDSSSH